MWAKGRDKKSTQCAKVIVALLYFLDFFWEKKVKIKPLKP